MYFPASHIRQLMFFTVHTKGELALFEGHKGSDCKPYSFEFDALQGKRQRSVGAAC